MLAILDRMFFVLDRVFAIFCDVECVVLLGWTCHV